MAFDPSFVPKSGKHTPGLGYFYSGCAGRELRGLELSGIAVVDQEDNTARLVACTDLSKDGGCVLEILYRDAKQHLGLTHCQARSKEKIHFHLNASLTTVSLAKAAHHLEAANQEQAFYLADIKTLYANELLLERFISTFGIDPNRSKINSLRDSVTNFGRMVA